MKSTFNCKWKNCNCKFSDRSTLHNHVVSHVDQQELDALVSSKSQTQKPSTQNNRTQSVVSQPSTSSVSTENKSTTTTASSQATITKETPVQPSTPSSSKKSKKTPSSSSQSASTGKASVETSKNEDDIICKYCLSPKYNNQNQIVQCDKCSNWFHQLCHVPFISDYYIKNVHIQWLCCDCKV